jgi:hypothetical protein
MLNCFKATFPKTVPAEQEYFYQHRLRFLNRYFIYGKYRKGGMGERNKN